MPFDGIVTKFIVDELKKYLIGGKINKIHQPEKHDIYITYRNLNKNYKLLVSANPSTPRVHLTTINKENPLSPPMFCMLLRKHLLGANILDVYSNDFERIITIIFENRTELEDLAIKKLVIEIMGKHSNIILLNNENKIIDSIKHVDFEVSSKREVMPARDYTLPPTQDKSSIYSSNLENILFEKSTGSITISKLLLSKIKGFSPVICKAVCEYSNIDPLKPLNLVSEQEKDVLVNNLNIISDDIKNSKYEPFLIIDNEHSSKKYTDYHCLNIFGSYKRKTLDTINEALDIYYTENESQSKLNQHKIYVNKILISNIDRCNKKISIHNNNIQKSIEDKKYKLFGELILSNLFNIKKGDEKVNLLNYYTNESIDIILDENLTPQENSQRFFKKYSKSKSSLENSTRQLKDINLEKNYLESVQQNLENCNTIEEISEITEELCEQNYIKKSSSKNKAKKVPASKPRHFKSSDSFDIYVGRNNKQNDILTLKTSKSNDIWLHTKDIPGSHVIIKTNGLEIPDKTLLEAAEICSFFSKAKYSSNVPIDYTNVKNVKKPPGSKPGMVIYKNFKTIYVTPKEINIQKLETN